jgi:hypothetical protein
MNKALMDGLVAKFLGSYDAPAKDAIWQQHSATFRRFWSEKVLSRGAGLIPDDECDVIIRILDRNGKGNTKASEAVARAMVPQGVWRKLFNALHTDLGLALLVDSAFKEKELDRKAALIDELHKANEGKKNWLTGETGNVLNALFAAYDPVNNLTVISLNARKTQMDFLKLELPFDWNQALFGQRVVQSNALLREGTRALGLDGTARTLSCFWYSNPVKELWKPEDTVKRAGTEEVSVTVPQNVEAEKDEKASEAELRESLQIQAILAEIGAQMGFQIWLPRADQTRVLTRWKPEEGELLDHLPVGFDQATMKTIEQIDVLWIKRRSIVRAFEVEHTTSIYSGLLRMADLLAMQPNLRIRLHIVAPVSRRDKVLREIRRPVFMLLEGGALSETCTYLSYDMVAEIRGQEHLKRLSDKVLEDYEERAGEAD